ncbi:MAG: hypothetical protein ACE5IJ_04005 [Thermoplasmata archaeon]
MTGGRELSSQTRAEGSAIRRLVHICLPLFLLYYLVPEDAWVGMDKRAILLGVFLFFLAFEVVRLSHRIRITGLRDYEMDRIGAYLWAGAGLTLAFLFFDFILVVPAVLGLAWVDPLNGMLRERDSSLYPWMPFVCYLTIVVIALYSLSDLDPQKIMMLSTAGAVAGIAAEHWKSRLVDDDFLMLIVPLVLMTLVSWIQNLQ